MFFLSKKIISLICNVQPQLHECKLTNDLIVIFIELTEMVEHFKTVTFFAYMIFQLKCQSFEIESITMDFYIVAVVVIIL